jgi:hypothetical protein
MNMQCSLERLRRAFASMTLAERQEMERLVVTTCLEVMRDCSDPPIRGEAFDLLRKILPGQSRWGGWELRVYMPGRWT